MVESTSEFNVIIVGAGLVGCSMALALQQQGLKIAIIEKHLPNFTGFFRPISLAYSSVCIFKTLGIWERLLAQACPIHNVHVSEQGRLGRLYFNAEQCGVDALGHVIPLHHLHRVVYEAASNQSGVTILAIETIEKIIALQDRVTVKLSIAGKTTYLHTPLLIGCDGTHSEVRERLRIPTHEHASRDVILTATLDLSDLPGIHQKNTAFERFSAAGVLALLPLKAHSNHLATVGCAWTMSNEQADVVKTWSEKKLAECITSQFIGRLPRITGIHQKNFSTLTSLISEPHHVPGVVLLGNAAHTIYPLAAQGFNLGLRDVAALAETCSHLPDIREALTQYQAWRLADQQKITCLTRNLSFITALTLPGACTARGLSLGMIDLLPPLKKRIARLMMGISTDACGKLPKLIRGIPLW